LFRTLLRIAVGSHAEERFRRTASDFLEREIDHLELVSL
jgi:hypothetical protein